MNGFPVRDFSSGEEDYDDGWFLPFESESENEQEMDETAARGDGGCSLGQVCRWF